MPVQNDTKFQVQNEIKRTKTNPKSLYFVDAPLRLLSRPVLKYHVRDSVIDFWLALIVKKAILGSLKFNAVIVQFIYCLRRVSVSFTQCLSCVTL